MARKNGLKNDTTCSLTFNSRTKAVMSDVVHDVNIKEKVNSVREVVSGKGNNEIVMVLQFYDYDVEKTIQAYLEDGAKQALMEWQFSGNKLVNKKRRNKKKGNLSQQSPVDIPQSPGSISTESESAAAILTNGKISMNGGLDYVTNLDATKTTKFIQNGPTTTSTYMLTSTNSMGNSPANYSTHAVFTSTVVPSVFETDISKITSKVQSSVNVTQSQLKKPDDSFSGQKSQVCEQPEVKTTSVRKEKLPSPQPQRQTHARQRMHSGPRHEESGNDYTGPLLEESGIGRVRTISSSSVDSKSGKKTAHGGLERSSKDLHRQTVSLERLRLIFNEEIDKSYKRIKSVFDEIRSCFNAREAQLLGEIEQTQNFGRETLNMRQSLAAELKMKIDRAERMNEAELADLRNEIKSFVSDRKIDDDLARNTRFLYDSDKMKLEVAAFGEVVPVKCTYIQRRQIVSSSESSSHVLLQPDHQEHLSLKTSIDIPKSSVHDKDSKPSLSHLDSSEMHEVAMLQGHLKDSIVSEGIPVETYPERPESAPVVESASRSFSNTSRSATARQNQNRPRPYNRGDRGQGGVGMGLKDDVRSSFNQTSSGERVILIGRKTGSQGSRPPRGEGGRSRGGYRGRGRGGSTPNVPREANSEDTVGSNSLGDNGSGNDAKSASQVSNSQGQNSSIGGLPQREGIGRVQRGGIPRSSNRGSYVNYRNRDDNHSNPAGSGKNLSQAKPIEHEQGATGGN